MSAGIATMGYYNPPGETIIEYVEVDTGSSDGWLETKRRPVASVTFRKKRKKRISVNVSLKEK